MHWSRDGKYLASLQCSSVPQASAAIWITDPATGRRNPLISTAQFAEIFGTSSPAHPHDEDGPIVLRPLLEDFAWSPDGRSLLLIAPTSLFWFDLDSGHSRRLIAGDEPLSDVKLSPDGHHISFVRNHALWLLDLTTAPARRFTPEGSDNLLEGEADWLYQNALHLKTAYWWSPDSSTIAYLETDDGATEKYSVRSSTGRERMIAYPKPGEKLPVVRLFVQAVNGGERHVIDLGTSGSGYLPLVSWLPNGSSLAIEWLHRDQKNLDLLLADAKTGKSHIVLTEKDDYWINLGEGPRFLSDSHRFLWTSERSGYRHLYLYGTNGRQLTQLTRGNWEITSLAGVDETRGHVYFVSTEKSPLERQLYRVNLDGSGISRITQSTGTHEATLSPNGNALIDIYSNRDTSPVAQLLHPDGSLIGPIGADEKKPFDASSLPPIEFQTVKMHLGMEIHALMIKPPGFDPAHKYPAIVYMDGGPEDQIVRDKWGGDTLLWLRMMAQKGYVIYAQDGRGTSGEGHVFEEPLHLRFSSQEMADQRDGTHYLRSLPYVDPQRIGIYGWGYGGYLVLHAMLDLPIAYKAGIAGAPVTDWRLYDTFFAERYLDDPVRNQDGYLSSSPMENAKNLRSPLLIVQGIADEHVHMENTLALLNEFMETGKYPSLMLVPDRGHNFADSRAKLALYEKMTDFFVKNL